MRITSGQYSPKELNIGVVWAPWRRLEETPPRRWMVRGGCGHAMEITPFGKWQCHTPTLSH
ncbi:MAG TPA: hypothetical protein VFQ79_06710, partial [Bryobacteraceae bacterium]|nr:hypothetical protein [Bryobacteraceae bacterium]